jgi:hypothetical protein
MQFQPTLAERILTALLRPLLQDRRSRSKYLHLLSYHLLCLANRPLERGASFVCGRRRPRFGDRLARKPGFQASIASTV